MRSGTADTLNNRVKGAPSHMPPHPNLPLALIMDMVSALLPLYPNMVSIPDTQQLLGKRANPLPMEWIGWWQDQHFIASDCIVVSLEDMNLLPQCKEKKTS